MSILREKGERLNKKLEQSKRHLKKPKTEVKNDTIRKLENNLLALKIFGGVSKIQIPLEIPEDETRLAELELIFNSEHQLSDNTDYEREAKELLIRYNAMTKKQRIKELSEQLENLSEDNEEYDKVLREIRDLQQSK